MREVWTSSSGIVTFYTFSAMILFAQKYSTDDRLEMHKSGIMDIQQNWSLKKQLSQVDEQYRSF